MWIPIVSIPAIAIWISGNCNNTSFTPPKIEDLYKDIEGQWVAIYPEDKIESNPQSGYFEGYALETNDGLIRAAWIDAELQEYGEGKWWVGNDGEIWLRIGANCWWSDSKNTWIRDTVDDLIEGTKLVGDTLYVRKIPHLRQEFKKPKNTCFADP